MAQSLRQAGDQQWSSLGYDTHARFVSDLATGVLDWLNPQPGERILDIGCGDGQLTGQLVDSGAIVVGVDASADFVATARARGIDARLLDGHELDFDCAFDAVFSNAALHWLTRPQQVVAGIARALKPGGRFVAEFGGHGNVAAIVTAMIAVALQRNGNQALAHPWYFPTPEAYAGVLVAEGFTVTRTSLIPRPTALPTDMAGWFMTFRAPFFDQFGGHRDDALEDAVAMLRPSLCDEKGQWTADYIRLRVEAVLTA